MSLSIGLLGLATASFGGVGVSQAVAAEDCNHTIFDGSGYIWDFEASPQNPGGVPPSVNDEYGTPEDGGSHGPAEFPPGPVKTEDAYDDWGDVYVYNPFANILTPTAPDKYDGPEIGCGFGLNGQEIIYPVELMQGLQVQHRWFADPGPLRGARILTVLHNPGAAAVPATVVQGDPSGFDDLGSDSATASRATSNGSNVFSAASFWGVSSDSATVDGDPALAHVWDGPGGSVRASEVVLGNANGADVLYWAWKNVLVQPGATVAFVSYEIQNAVPDRSAASEVALAVAQANARETQSSASLYNGMSAAEIAGTLNWAHPPATAVIAPIKKPNAATPVTLNGSGSLAATGLPQCAISSYAWKTDDGKLGIGPIFKPLLKAGKHKATLTVTSNCGATASAEVAFKVAKGFQFGKAKANRKQGTAKLKVKVLGPGTLSVKGKGVKKAVKKVKKAGTVSINLVPIGKAHKKLEDKGKVKVKLTVTLTPKGGKPEKQSKSVTFKLAG
ncbi:MAG TPA: hypothetical protein VGO24_04865 [Solirubrobacterales bacterium]|nr:hypothetical protein [Solirubrobacterales bacterium]